MFGSSLPSLQAWISANSCFSTFNTSMYSLKAGLEIHICTRENLNG
jgi:hypothetical protein